MEKSRWQERSSPVIHFPYFRAGDCCYFSILAVWLSKIILEFTNRQTMPFDVRFELTKWKIWNAKHNYITEAKSASIIFGWNVTIAINTVKQSIIICTHRYIGSSKCYRKEGFLRSLVSYYFCIRLTFLSCFYIVYRD